MAKRPAVKRSKGAPRFSIRKTAILVGVFVVIAAFSLEVFALSVNPPHPSHCSSLTPYEQSQRKSIYDTYPTINASAAVTSFICDNPDFNYGEQTSPSAEAALGDNGIVVIHAFNSTQQASASDNTQPGALLYVAIAHIANYTAASPPRVVSTWLDLTNPDPPLSLIFQELGLG